MARDEPPGSAYHYTENLSLGHDVWDIYYPLPNGLPFFDWMFSQSARGPGGLSNIAVDDTTTGDLTPATARIYNGPVQGLWSEYIAITNDSLNVAVGSGGWFIHTGGDTDAISAYSGTNVLDGGTGSNFLTGGSGTDTFFVDDRGAAADIWSTRELPYRRRRDNLGHHTGRLQYCLVGWSGCGRLYWPDDACHRIGQSDGIGEPAGCAVAGWRSWHRRCRS